ncbi:MAG: DUF541 domain-containing protein, partial [Actinomycetales bacterium]
GSEKDEVVARAKRALDPLVSQLGELQQRGALATWSSDQVRVISQHPWAGDRRSDEVVHTASFGVRAEFVDFEKLAGFVDHWAGRDHVEVHGLAWDVLASHRRAYVAEVRKAAVDDAVATAQAYADAVRRGRVTPVEIADPGMLGDGSGGGGAAPMMAKAAFADLSSDGGPGLRLEPEDILIEVSVDARFTTD